jgi:hypothetical protein
MGVAMNTNAMHGGRRINDPTANAERLLNADMTKSGDDCG